MQNRPAPPSAGRLALAIELHTAGRLEEAAAAYRALIALDEDDVEALHLLGLLLTQTGRAENGLALIDRALALAPELVEAHNSRGAALNGLKRYEEAAVAFERALALRPAYPEALVNRGNALNLMRRYDAAIDCYDRALTLQPHFAEAHYNRGVALARLNRRDDAIAAYDRALASQPLYFDALYNRGNALQELRRFPEAVAAYDVALALRPRHPQTINNRGNALRALGRDEEARACFALASAVAPDYVDPVFNRGLAALRDGDFATGWAGYELRWVAGQGLRRNFEIDAPLWRGEPIAGRSIAVYEEQGLGDVIQFCRYLELLEALGAEATLCVSPNMAALMRGRGGRARVVCAIPDGERFDFQCPIASLPYAFRTDLFSIPAAQSYISADPSRVATWRERIGVDGFRIGVCWAGSEMGRALGKCFPPEMFLGLGRVPGVRLISLQMDASPPEGIETLGPDLDAGGDAFVDTAAAMMSLDLVVTADTSITHLAGALGRPVWVALPSPADWRWLRERADSPWYPTMRLFRQRRQDDWAQVFADIEAALRAQIECSF